MIKNGLYWANSANNLTTILTNPQINSIGLVKEYRDEVLKYLEKVEVTNEHIHPPRHESRPDLTNPDYGVVYYLHFRKTYKGKKLNALYLFRRCLSIIERGELLEYDKVRLPYEMQSMAGIVSKQNSENQKPKRKRIKKELNDAIDVLVKNNPYEGFDKLMPRLEGESMVINWSPHGTEGNTKVEWIDSNGDVNLTPASTVKTWITNAKKLIK